MPIPKELYDMISEDEKTIPPAQIIAGLARSKNYPDIAGKVRQDLQAGMKPEEIISAMKGSVASPQTIDNVLPPESEREFAARNPDLYGAYGAAKETAKSVGRGVLSFPGSTLRLVEDIGRVVLHPKDTAQALGSIATDPKMRAAAGKELIRPYSSPENIKQTLEEDPARILGDLSTLLTAGGGAARVAAAGGKAVGITKAARLAQIGAQAQKAATIIDPITGVGKVIRGTGKLAKKGGIALEGMLTGKGSAAVENAFRASDDFRKAMRGEVTGGEIATTMRDAVKQIKDERGAAYAEKMAQMPEYFDKPANIVPLEQSFRSKLKQFGMKIIPVEDETGKVVNQVTYKGQRLNIPANKELLDNANEIQRWFDSPGPKSLKSLDEFKKDLTRMWEPKGKNGAFITGLRKDTDKFIKINDPSGMYSEITGEYSKSTKLLNEADKVFSVGVESANKPALDTTMRKMLTAMREDQDFRRALLKTVEEKSGYANIDELMSGYLMSTVQPSGIIGKGVTLGSGFQILNQGLSSVDPAFLGVLLASSPRVVGELAYHIGRGPELVRRGLMKLPSEGQFMKIGGRLKTEMRKVLPQAMYQSGRMQKVQDERSR